MSIDRHPRSLAEAFGPYTSNDLQPMSEPRARRVQDLAIYVVAILALIVLSAVPFL